METLPTGILTFVFTDIEGSTRLWEQFPEQMQRSLERHTELIVSAVEKRGGVFVRTRGEGDSTFSVFTSPSEAVAAACDFQRAMAQETWPPETVLRMRAALHTGTGYLFQADYNSSDVNRCARLRAISHGGQTLLSKATYALTQSALPEGVTLQDLGLHWLKDLREPEHVYQLQHPDLPTGFPPLNSLNALPNNLPRLLSSFIGREEEMPTLQGLLKTTPLLTLVGMGGTGKTRLALQAAAAVLETYPAGVWLVELAALSDPAFVPQAVAKALGLREQSGQPLTQTLIDYLQSRKLLLVLDNCEHLIGACASLVETLLRSCPEVSILATSREPLNRPGEHVWRVPALSLPEELPSEESEQVAAALGSDACRLFVERVRLLRPEFELSRSTAPVAVRICRRLEGIPLALELAAARTRALSVEQIESRLDDRFRLLSGGSRGGQPRQQTLRALIDWSYDLLSEAERALLKRLSVFTGGWTLEEAEAVCLGEGVERRACSVEEDPSNIHPSPLAPHPTPLESWEVLDLLSSLVDKSLALAEEKEGAVRYRMLEMVRQYAAEKLAESGEEALLRRQHRDWYLALCEAAEPKLSGPEQGAWLARLETEHANLRAALAWSQSIEDRKSKIENPDSHPPTLLRLCAALRQFWFTRGYWKEGRTWCAAALEAEGAQERTTVRAKTLNGAGTLAHSEGDYAAAQACYAESLAIRCEIGDRQGIATLLINLGNMARLQGDYVAAQTCYLESLSLWREIGGQRDLAYSLEGLAWLASLLILAETVPANSAGTSENRSVGTDLKQAARLWGAAQALREQIVTQLPAQEQAIQAREVEAAQERLGKAEWETAWAEGRAMPLEEVMNAVLEGSRKR